MCQHCLEDDLLRQFHIRQLAQLYVLLLLRYLQPLELLAHDLHDEYAPGQQFFIHLEQVLVFYKDEHHIELLADPLTLNPLIQLVHTPEHLDPIIVVLEVLGNPRLHMRQLIIKQKAKVINSSVDIRVRLLLSSNLLLTDQSLLDQLISVPLLLGIPPHLTLHLALHLPQILELLLNPKTLVLVYPELDIVAPHNRPVRQLKYLGVLVNARYYPYLAL